MITQGEIDAVLNTDWNSLSIDEELEAWEKKMESPEVLAELRASDIEKAKTWSELARKLI